MEFVLDLSEIVASEFVSDSSSRLSTAWMIFCSGRRLWVIVWLASVLKLTRFWKFLY